MTVLPITSPLRAWAERRNILIGARAIAPGDEAKLWPEEARRLGSSLLDRLRASGAARGLARNLLSSLLAPPCAILADADRVPLWPPGFVGSLAHDETHALAAVARETDVAALGVDLEPARRLEPEMTALVATPAERARYDDELLGGVTLFVIKEAVFKALFPADRRFLEFRDVEVDLEAGIARARYGARCAFFWESGVKIYALATRES